MHGESACAVCNVTIVPDDPRRFMVCDACRPAFDVGRSYGMKQAIVVIGERLKPVHPDYRALVSALSGAMRQCKP